MIFGRSDSRRTQGEIITDAVGSDPRKLEQEAGAIGKAFITAVDKAVHLQSGSIKAYVNWLRRQNPDATPAEVQAKMERHFRTTVSGTGAGAGAASAVPGIGLLTGAAAIAGESVVFLDLAAFYTVASAYLRGVDIDDPERRRAIVLIALTGSQGLAVVDTILGSSTAGNVSILSRFSGPKLTEANNILTRTALRSVTKRLRRAWLGKFLPLGIGAIAGTVANRKLATVVADNVASSLGPLPPRFAQALPSAATTEEDEVTRSASPRAFINYVRNAVGDKGGDKDPKAVTRRRRWTRRNRG